MIRLSRALGVIVVLVLTLATLPTVAAASLSKSYSIEGIETAATSTQGTFVGTGAGAGGDEAVWQAIVVHQVLASSCYLTAQGCAITGERSRSSTRMSKPSTACSPPVRSSSSAKRRDAAFRSSAWSARSPT